MIRHMQLLDAQATIVQDPTANEQRMIISSKCGSKFVTMICKQFLGVVPSIIFMQLIDCSAAYFDGPPIDN